MEVTVWRCPLHRPLLQLALEHRLRTQLHDLRNRPLDGGSSGPPKEIRKKSNIGNGHARVSDNAQIWCGVEFWIMAFRWMVAYFLSGLFLMNYLRHATLHLSYSWNLLEK